MNRGNVTEAMIRRVINKKEEVKSFPFSDDTTSSSTPELTRLTGIPAGSDGSQRVGDVSYIKSLFFKWNSRVADSTNFVRVIVFQWFEDDAVDIPDGDKILTDMSFISSAYTYGERRKRSILYDKTMAQSLQGPACGSAEVMITEINKRKIYYNPALVSGKNNIWMLQFSDSGLAIHPGIQWTSLVRFTDA